MAGSLAPTGIIQVLPAKSATTALFNIRFADPRFHQTARDIAGQTEKGLPLTLNRGTGMKPRRNVFSHDIAAGSNVRADGGAKLRRLDAQALPHRGDGLLRHAGLGAAPTHMKDARSGARTRPKEKRQAIGDEDPENPGTAADDPPIGLDPPTGGVPVKSDRRAVDLIENENRPPLQPRHSGGFPAPGISLHVAQSPRRYGDYDAGPPRSLRGEETLGADGPGAKIVSRLTRRHGR